MYACHGKFPNPASSPPTIRLWATCFASEIPQPEIRFKKFEIIRSVVQTLMCSLGTMKQTKHDKICNWVKKRKEKIGLEMILLPLRRE